jgi:hypothetical protein
MPQLMTGNVEDARSSYNSCINIVTCEVIELSLSHATGGSRHTKDEKRLPMCDLFPFILPANVPLVALLFWFIIAFITIEISRDDDR